MDKMNETMDCFWLASELASGLLLDCFWIASSHLFPGPVTAVHITFNGINVTWALQAFRGLDCGGEN